jgi:hypothetical protein
MNAGNRIAKVLGKFVLSAEISCMVDGVKPLSRRPASFLLYRMPNAGHTRIDIHPTRLRDALRCLNVAHFSCVLGDATHLSFRVLGG